MAKDDINGLRAQILANARLMLRPSQSQHSSSQMLPTVDTSTTLVDSTALPEPDVVIFGSSSKFTAAIMVGLTPAIEGPECPTPEISLLKLLNATCELLSLYMPKVGSHQRNIHGGGVFDEDLISPELIEAQMKAS